MNVIERFRDRLEGLELERLKVVRDRKGFLFLGTLVGLLSACCILSGAFAASALVFGLGVFLALVSVVSLSMISTVDQSYQQLFRERVTREWFRERFGSAYLAAPPEIPSEDLQWVAREAAIRVANMNPQRTRIEDRILFDRDSHAALQLTLTEAKWLGRSVRSIVWCHLRTNESQKVAFIVPALLGEKRNPEIRFFENGIRSGVQEPLASQLMALYQKAQAVFPNSQTRVAFAPRGVFIGCRLKRRLFAAPVTTSCLSVDAFGDWEADAARLLSSEIKHSLGSLF